MKITSSIGKSTIFMVSGMNAVTKQLIPRVLIIVLTSILSHMAMADDQSADVAIKQSVNAAYIPLADHYAALIAFEKYRSKMKFADFTITRMKSLRIRC